MKKLRLALAVSHIPRDLNDRSISPHISLPVFWGGRSLAPLDEAEVKLAHAIQKQILEDSDQYVGKSDSDENKLYDVAEIREKCKSRDPDFLLSCELYKNYRTQQFVHQRGVLAKISNNIISEFPFVTNFTELPITNQHITRALNQSLTDLKDSTQKLNSDPQYVQELSEGFYKDVMNEVLTEHPEFCKSFMQVYGEHESARKSHERKVRVVELVAVVGVCVFTNGLGCLLGSGAAATPSAIQMGAQSRRERSHIVATSNKSHTSSESGGNRDTLARIDQIQNRETDMLASLP